MKTHKEAIPSTTLRLCSGQGSGRCCTTRHRYGSARGRFGIRRRFRYASLQSEIGKRLLEERHIDSNQVDSIVLIEPGVAYFLKSDAALEIANELGWPWKALYLFNYILPVQLRNNVYDLIARNRYRWFGKKDQCMIPTPSLRSKFLDTSP